jgi:hypothetical protein
MAKKKIPFLFRLPGGDVIIMISKKDNKRLKNAAKGKSTTHQPNMTTTETSLWKSPESFNLNHAAVLDGSGE